MTYYRSKDFAYFFLFVGIFWLLGWYYVGSWFILLYSSATNLEEDIEEEEAIYAEQNMEFMKERFGMTVDTFEEYETIHLHEYVGYEQKYEKKFYKRFDRIEGLFKFCDDFRYYKARNLGGSWRGIEALDEDDFFFVLHDLHFRDLFIEYDNPYYGSPEYDYFFEYDNDLYRNGFFAQAEILKAFKNLKKDEIKRPTYERQYKYESRGF